MFPTKEDHQKRLALLDQLRASGDPAAIAKADELQRAYHADNMAVLAKDTYFAAMGNKAEPHEQLPPPGWIRASENIDLLRKHAPGLANESKEKILQMLKPDDSGFRAEIYLPDPEVLGPGYKPVIVPKGSAGQILGPDGQLHSSAVEDFLGNNFVQAIGLRSDYYQHGMELADFMERAGLKAEYAGHSLGGGVSSAMSAITGRPATTWNAAGLHPETAARFAREKGLQVHDTSRLVTSYQIAGELLNDGLQHNVERLDVHHRRQLAGVLKEAGELLHEMPAGRLALEKTLTALAPVHAHESIKAFVGKLATEDTDRLLNELPLAAGRVVPIDQVKTYKDGQLVDRFDALTLQEVSTFAGPLLDAAQQAARGAHVGHRVGEVPAMLGRGAAAAYDGAGDALEAVGRQAGSLAQPVAGLAAGQVQAGLAVAGVSLASARQAAATVEAGIEAIQGVVQTRSAAAGASVLRGIGGIDALPDAIQDWARRGADDLQRGGEQAQARNAAQAAAARHSGDEDARAIGRFAGERIVDLERVQAVVGETQRDTLREAGKAANAALDVASQDLRLRAELVPTAGAAVGAGLGGMGELASHTSLEHARSTMVAASGLSSGWQAAERHLMSETVLPSMAHQIQSLEAEAKRLLPAAPERPAPAPPSRPAAAEAAAPSSPSSPAAAHPLLPPLRAGIGVIDAGFGKPYDDASERVSRCLLVACRDPTQMYPGQTVSLSANVLNRIDHVLMGHNGNVFAVEGPLDDPASKRAFVSLEQAARTPLEVSDQKLAAAEQAIAQEQQRNQAQQQQHQRTGPAIG